MDGQRYQKGLVSACSENYKGNTNHRNSWRRKYIFRFVTCRLTMIYSCLNGEIFYDHYKTLLLLIFYYQIKEKRKLSYCKTNRFIKMLLKLSNYNLRIGLLNCDLLNVTDNILSRKRSSYKKWKDIPPIHPC